MPAFEYQALDTSGRERKGVLEGDTPRQVRQQLRDQGLAPVVVQEVHERASAGGKRRAPLFGRRGISAAALALFARQLATLVRSALPVEESLQAVAQQTEQPRVKAMIMAVRSRVLEGHTLAAGLSDFPQAFPNYFRATIAAGEQSGHLDVVLERLADYAENRQQLGSKFQLALLYPALISAVAILVVTFLLAYVVPQVVQVFENIGQQLPLLTRGLIALSAWVRSYGIALLIVIGIGVAVFNYLLRRPPVLRAWHALLLRLPLIGRLLRGMNAARFARTFSILAASGVPVVEGLRISAAVLSNVPMREAIDDAAARVREGASLRIALGRSGLLPPMMLHLISSGETSGALEVMLDRAAMNQEREMETYMATLLGLFEPLLILVMGGLVLLIVIAILLPIFDLNQLVK
ncbi:MAG: type II secretion system inner membrane protein GspF [Gammaproteobacteria bacterium]